jgi:tRNA A37 threonylcarbamoyladenosine synthetase subunit TsaC/SUA5/YrdC
VSHPSRRTIGLRVPDHRVAQALLALMGQPLLATTLILPDQTEALNDSHEIRELLQKRIQAVVDAGACPLQSTTVIDLSQGGAEVIRQGRGDAAALGLLD